MKKLCLSLLSLRLLVLLTLILAAWPADAQEAPPLVINGEGTITLSWTNATRNTDGSVLDPADIESVVIFYGTESRIGRSCVPFPSSPTDTGCYPLATEVTADGATTTDITLTISESTTFYFAGVTKANGGILSEYSVEAEVPLVLVLEAHPLPPTGITIDVTITCTTDNPGIDCRFDVT